MSQALPREMQSHTYVIMREVEDAHWWYVGRRRIISSFVKRICEELRAEGNTEPRALDFYRARYKMFAKERLKLCLMRAIRSIS
jgi:hypothetical protein